MKRSGARDVMSRTFDQATGRVIVTLRGSASLAEWAALVRQLVDRDSRELHLDRIIDTREFAGEWSSTEIRAIANDFSYAVRAVTGRLALVADTPTTRDMWRMFITLLGDTGNRVALFDTIEDAAAWLNGA